MPEWLVSHTDQMKFSPSRPQLKSKLQAVLEARDKLVRGDQQFPCFPYWLTGEINCPSNFHNGFEHTGGGGCRRGRVRIGKGKGKGNGKGEGSMSTDLNLHLSSIAITPALPSWIAG